MSRLTPILPAGSAAVLSLATVLAASVLPTAPASAEVKANGPTCDQIAGTTLSSNSRWRILSTTPEGASGDATTLACRRIAARPVRVRILGTTTTDGYGTYLSVSPLAGDRTIVRAGSSGSMAGYGELTLVDLRTGGSASIGSTSYETEYSGTAVVAALAPGGGLASAAWTSLTNGTPVATAGPLMVWGPQGPVGTPLSAGELVPSRGTGGTTGGVYYRAADGTAGRLEIPAPAAGDAVDSDSGLKWRRPTLAKQRVVTRRGHTFSPTRTVDGLTDDATLQTEVKDARRRTDRTTWLTYGPKRYRIANLTPGSAPELRVVAATASGVLVLGHFADRPSESRLRFIGFSGDPLTFDIPATATMTSPGRATVDYRGRIAVAEENQITLYGPYGMGTSRTIAMTAPHDLALSRDGLFATDGAGAVHLEATGS